MQVLQVQLEIRPDPAEVGRARRWARSRLAGSGIGVDEPLAETLILLVSELVTNAVVHTGCPAVLRLSLPGVLGESIGTVRLEVADSSARPRYPGMPRATRPTAAAWSWSTAWRIAGAGTPRARARASGARSTAVRRAPERGRVRGVPYEDFAYEAYEAV